MVVFGVVGPLVGGFLWVGLLWLFAGVIVWLALALTVILLLVMTILCYVKAGLAPNLTSALGLDGADNNISICNAPQSDDARSTPSPREQRERERERPANAEVICARELTRLRPPSPLSPPSLQHTPPEQTTRRSRRTLRRSSSSRSRRPRTATPTPPSPSS